MATASRLRAELEKRKIRSSSERYFISNSDLSAVFTAADVRQLVAELKCRTEDRVGLPGELFAHGRTTLAILVWLRQENSILNFRTRDILDKSLPLENVEQANALAPGVGNEFVTETQWMFLPYQFGRNMAQSHKEIRREIILPFVNEENLGDGGFGEVLKVTIPASLHQFTLDPDPTGNLTIVRKRIKRLRGQSAKSAKRAFDQEKKCLLLLQHPNIVTFLGSYQYKEEYNFLFSLFDMDLEKMLELELRLGDFKWDFTFFGALYGLASALSKLHNHNLALEEEDEELQMTGYHHDFRPKNILVNQKTFMLADFGLAKLKVQETYSKTPWKVGTGDYLAPECMNQDFKNQNVGRGIDIWALGCLIVEVATYMEKGPEGLKQFRKQRDSEGVQPGWTDQNFFDKSGVKPEVQDWISELKTHTRTAFLEELLEVAETALEMDPDNRPKAEKISQALYELNVKAHFVAVQSALSEYVDLVNKELTESPLRMKLWKEMEILHLFGTVLGLVGDNKFPGLLRSEHEILKFSENLKSIFDVCTSQNHKIKVEPGPQTKDINFTSRFDEEVSKNVDRLLQWLPRQYTEEIKTRLPQLEKACLESIYDFEFYEYNNKIVSKSFDNSEWILRQPEYKTWLKADSSSLLWVFGSPGNGKSDLASFLIKELAPSLITQSKAMPIVAYVFCSISALGKKDARWMLTTILHWLLKDNPSLMRKHVLPAYQKQSQENLTWTFDTVSQMFRGVMRDIDRAVFVVIDRFNDIEESSRKEFLDLLTPFLNQKGSNPIFKAIIITKAHSKPRDMLKQCLQIEITSNSARESLVPTPPKGFEIASSQAEWPDKLRLNVTIPSYPLATPLPQSPPSEKAFRLPECSIQNPSHATSPPTLRTFIAATCWTGWNYRVYFQDSSSRITEVSQSRGKWTIRPDTVGISDAKPHSPLAAINRFNGKEIRLFYVTKDNSLHEHCYYQGSEWSSGALKELGIIVFDEETNTWRKGRQLETAMLGSSLAAVTLINSVGRSIHTYFQCMNSHIKEIKENIDDDSYSTGPFPLLKTPVNTTLTAVSWMGNSANIRLYWQAGNRKFMEATGPDEWEIGMNEIPEPIPYENDLPMVAVEWGSGSYRRLYTLSKDLNHNLDFVAKVDL
ncbi:hypothetical protein G7Y89_g12041 [Cudoniella acicularis]|uniref:Protein kinase domain-containing protein n=1 Tax=Cudoniella acicularis TaxID=354080 RepID=A0A8H4R9N4_9HELO|nr:hypothetical protein G7Y89_g12041 [Cudoniella acicularis]